MWRRLLPQPGGFEDLHHFGGRARTQESSVAVDTYPKLPAVVAVPPAWGRAALFL
jgi:hypothetical protein